MRSLLTPFVPRKLFFRAHGTLRLTSGHLDAWCIAVSQYIVLLPADCIDPQIFELIVGGSLFLYKSYPEYMLDEPTGHLWQMLCFTRERMTREQVNSSTLGAQYFDLAVKPNAINSPFCMSLCLVIIFALTIYTTNSGDLKAHPPVFNNPFARSLRNYQVLQEVDVLATAKIMQRCLRLNPRDRATAEELLQDPWWHGAV